MKKDLLRHPQSAGDRNRSCSRTILTWRPLSLLAVAIVFWLLVLAFSARADYERPVKSKQITPMPVAGEVIYTVRNGDTLWRIAQVYGVPVAVLQAVNKVHRPEFLHVGQRLTIPPASEVPALLAALPTATPQPTPVPASPPAVPEDVSAWSGLIVAGINERRASHGLPPLVWSQQLAEAAQSHASECALRARCGHVGGDGATLGQRLQRVQYPFVDSGENWVFSRNPVLALRWWYDEPPGADPHRRNILSPRYTQIGVGMAEGAWGHFYFVVDFARPAS